MSSKIYFCKSLKDGKECGETYPGSFQTGRYTVCKECKNNYHKKYNKQFYEMKKQDAALPIIERMNKGIGNIGDNSNELFRRIIENEPLPSIGIAIPAKLDSMEEKLKKDFDAVYEEIREVKKENISLRNHITQLTTKLSATESLLNLNITKLQEFDNYIKYKYI